MTSAEETAAQIALAMGSKMRRHGREWRVPCPVHENDGGNHNPSLSLWDKPGGGFAMKCMTGCAKPAIVTALKTLGVALPKAPALTPEEKVAQLAAREQSRIEKVTAARDLFDNSDPILKGGAVDYYLQGRGLSWGIYSPTVRGVADPLHPSSPALLCPIIDLTTYRDPEPLCTGVVTLSLKSDGTPRLDGHGHKLRSVHGIQRGYGVVIGATYSERMVVGEGVETVIAAMELLDCPLGVATLSSSNMRPLRVPSWIHRVEIAADDDAPGLVAANQLEASLRKWCSTRVLVWGEGGTGWDANDELMKRKGLK